MVPRTLRGLGAAFLAANGASLFAASRGRADLCLPIAAASSVVFAIGLTLDERLQRPSDEKRSSSPASVP